jgi:hypothetical protein
MRKVEITILKYLGKLETGILVLVSVNFPSEDLTFDAHFFYTDTHVLLTVPYEIDEVMGYFKKLPEYPGILEQCIKKVVPHQELWDRIDPLDVSPYLKIFNDEDGDNDE